MLRGVDGKFGDYLSRLWTKSIRQCTANSPDITAKFRGLGVRIGREGRRKSVGLCLTRSHNAPRTDFGPRLGVGAAAS